jgi:hypothetical protein
MSKTTLRERLSMDVDDVLDWVYREKIQNKADFLDDLAAIFEDKNETQLIRLNALSAFQAVAQDVQMPNMSSLVQRLILLGRSQKESDAIRAGAQGARASCLWDKTTS